MDRTERNADAWAVRMDEAQDALSRVTPERGAEDGPTERNAYEPLVSVLVVHITSDSLRTYCGRVIDGMLLTHDGGRNVETCAVCWAAE